MLFNLEQADKTMKEGQKVTNVEWLDGDYLEMVGMHNQIVDDSGNLLPLLQMQSLPIEGWFKVSDTLDFTIRLEDLKMRTYKHLDYPQLLDRAILELKERRDELDVISVNRA
jgi:hypothetical protein